MITTIVPNYRSILTEVKERETPTEYEPGVVARLKRLVTVFPERVMTRYAAADLLGLVARNRERRLALICLRVQKCRFERL